MSDLQLALIALGALIIVAVLIVNWLQEKSIRKKIAAQFSEQSNIDPLFSEDKEVDFNIDIPDEEAVVVTRKSNSAPSLNAKNPIPNADTQFVNASVADAVSAVAEFERDLAESAETKLPDHLIDADDDEWHIPPEAEEIADPAPPEELMVEAGFEMPDDIAASKSFEKALGKSEIELIDTLPAVMNQQIDLIAELFFRTPVSGNALREFLISVADLDKQVYAYGLTDDGVWRLLTREQEANSFMRAACSIQLADRGGSISANTLGRFQQAVDYLGNSLSAQVEWFGDLNPLKFATELDQFCMEVDKLVGFNLVQGVNGPFTGTKFRGLAEAGGLVLGEDGTFHYLADGAQPLYTLSNQDKNPFSPEMLRTMVIHGVTFQLDIPRVKNCIDVFNQMVMLARQMEHSLNCRLVDANQKALDDGHIDKIRQEIRVIQAKMLARGIVPGSPYALRLFS